MQVADWQLATQVVRDNAWVVAVLNVVASWPPGNLEWVRGATKAAELMSRTDLAPHKVRFAHEAPGCADLLSAIAAYRAAALADRHRTRRNAMNALAEWRTLVERPERAAFAAAVVAATAAPTLTLMRGWIWMPSPTAPGVTTAPRSALPETRNTIRSERPARIQSPTSASAPGSRRIRLPMSHATN